ncbi:hypothetical protein C0992_003641 [Termitomyces sp. T32_za158]|nr:hypothetical protein C0992_003641 [Termitomyces sp. T32_za158]
MDLDVYYREQAERMNLPDENIDDYLVRIGVHRNSRNTIHERKIKIHDHSQAQGERGSVIEHVSSTSGKMDNSSPSKKTTDKLSQRPHGRAANMSVPSWENLVVSGPIEPFEAEASSLNDKSQKLLLQMRKRKALPAQTEQCTPPKKSILSMSPVTEALRYHAVKATPSSSGNFDSSNTTSKSGALSARGNSASLDEGVMVSQDKLEVLADSISRQEDSMVHNEPLPSSNPRKSVATSATPSSSAMHHGGLWNKGGSPELQDKNISSALPEDDLFTSNSRSEGALSVNSCVYGESTLDKPSSPSYAPTPSTPTMLRQTSRKLKRKALSVIGSSPVQKKRHFQMGSPVSSSIEEIADISSFSDSFGSKSKAALRRTPFKGKTALLGKIPPLVLKSIAPLGPTSHGSDPPTSPLEEISTIESSNSIDAAPSLYLEVKQRIAAHVSTRRRDKHLKLPSKSAAMASRNATDEDDESVIDLSSASSSPRSSPRSSSPPKAVASIKRRDGKPTTYSDTTISKGKNKEVAEKPKAKGTKNKKEKPAPVTPEEYAQRLVNKVQAKMVAASTDMPVPNHKFLHGMNIFYTGGDMTYASERTRGRMSLIVRHGGTLLPRYDPSITTHIVTDAKVPATLRALGLNDLSEIPNHIPTVTWDWVLKGFSRPSGMKKDMKMHMDDLAFWHAAFVQRIDAGIKIHPRANDKGKAKVEPKTPDALEFSHISQDKPRRTSTSSSRSIRDVNDSEGDEQNVDRAHGALLSPPISPDQTGRGSRNRRTSSSVVQVAGLYKAPDNDDPLAEFYAKARAEAETEWARRGEVTESEGPPSESDGEEQVVARGPPAQRGWTCDTKETQRKTCVNQDIIDKLEELKTLHAAKVGDEDRWRVFSYSKCIRALRNYPKRITSFAEARAIRGVGEKTAAKIMEIIETGGLRRIGYERTDDVKTTKIFQGVYGVGQSTAYQWYAAGCRSLADVVAGKGGVKLTPAQKIGIRFYDGPTDDLPMAIFEV